MTTGDGKVTVKEFFNMTMLIYGKGIDINVYPNVRDNYSKTLCYNNYGEQHYFPDVIEEVGDLVIGYIETFYHFEENIIEFKVYVWNGGD